VSIIAPVGTAFRTRARAPLSGAKQGTRTDHRRDVRDSEPNWVGIMLEALPSRPTVGGRPNNLRRTYVQSSSWTAVDTVTLRFREMIVMAAADQEAFLFQCLDKAVLSTVPNQNA
jgi:hypothetical protein